MARILSTGLMVATTGATTGRRAAGAAVGAAGAAGLGLAAAVAEDFSVVELGGIGTNGDPVEAPVGPPGGNVGSLMVGAAVGLGGRLMRTVSFLG
jgi:hypothetical protein